MKRILALLFIATLFTCVLSSCTIEKRVHMSGYYIDWKSWKHVPQKHEWTDVRKKSTMIKMETKAVTSFDNVLTASADNTITSVAVKKIPQLTAPQKKSRIEIQSTVVPEECDLIILTSGEEIKAKVIEIGVEEIKYKACDNLEGPTYIKYKWDVFMIKYPNGTNTVITPQNKPTINGQTPYTGEKQIEILSLVSFCMSLLGLALLAVTGFPFLMGIGAIITGAIGLSKFKNHPGKYSGQGFAIAGIVIGAFVILLFWLILIFALLFFATWGLWF